MPLIPAQPTAPARDTLSLRLDRDLHEQLKAYAEFIGGAKDYVINHAIRRVLRQDKEFAVWLEARAQRSSRSEASDDHQMAAPQTDGQTRGAPVGSSALHAPAASLKRS